MNLWDLFPKRGWLNLYVDDVKFVPNWMVKAGLSHDNGRGLRFGLFNSYLEEPTRVERINPASVKIINPRAEGYHHLTAHLSLNLNQYFDPSVCFPYLVTTCLNLMSVLSRGLDSEFNTIPNWSERGLYAKLSIRY